MIRVSRIIGVNAALIGAVIVGLELTFGGWFRGIDPLFEFSRPKNVQWSFAVPWQPDGALYTRDRYGLRGLDGPLEDVFILTMGGSTTDQRYLGDDQTWQHVLQTRLEAGGSHLDVVNAGIDGQSTVGHIKNFSQWLPRLEGLRARYILFLIGVNEFYVGAESPYDRDLVRYRPFRQFLERSALVALGRVLRELARGPQTEGPVDQRPGHNFGGVNTSAYVERRALEECCNDKTFQEAVAALRQRIGVLADMTRAIGSEAIFVNQRSSHWTRRDGTVVGAPSLSYAPPSILADLGNITGVDRHDLEAIQADAIMSACQAASAMCIDLFNEIEFDVERDFYDSLHATPAGAQIMGSYLHGALDAYLRSDK